ncbi:hypothetical protein [Xanthomonas sacchari]|nr:hypothetical protein [Xanthomonas sacchari]
MTTLTQARLDVAFHRLAVRICKRAERAKLPSASASSDSLPVFSGFTYVAAVRVKYSVSQPLYDDHPYDDMLTYQSWRSVGFELAPMGLHQARLHLGDTWATVTSNVDSMYLQLLDEDWNEEGHIAEIQLLDPFGNVVDVINDRAPWIQDSQIGGDIEVMKARVAELKAESAFESGWDNFETSRHLADQASAIAAQLSMIQYRGRLVN